MLTAVKGNCLKRLCDDKPKCWIYWYRSGEVLQKSDTIEDSKEEEPKGEGEGSKEHPSLKLRMLIKEGRVGKGKKGYGVVALAPSFSLMVITPITLKGGEKVKKELL